MDLYLGERPLTGRWSLYLGDCHVLEGGYFILVIAVCWKVEHRSRPPFVYWNGFLQTDNGVLQGLLFVQINHQVLECFPHPRSILHVGRLYLSLNRPPCAGRWFLESSRTPRARWSLHPNGTVTYLRVICYSGQQPYDGEMFLHIG